MKHHFWPAEAAIAMLPLLLCLPLPTLGQGPGAPQGDSTCVLTVFFITVVCTVILPITAPGQTDTAA